MAVPERSTLQVDVVSAARAPVIATYVRSVIREASHVPEVAARLPLGRPTLAVRLTSDAELRRLHRDYSSDDTVTDVLSFRGDGDHLGDLAISWPAVNRQASEYGHPARTELALLCVHGFLHLLGWDHATAAQRREMTRVTLVALSRCGLEPAPGRL